MEVYQSTKTAAEMEYALSAVPSIGENGNWFIGDQDTGVFASGVNVTGAEVGQIIKIKEVNGEGLPVAWEAADEASVDISGASENQIPQITAVDESGKPTEWGAVNRHFAGERVEIFNHEFAEEIQIFAHAVDYSLYDLVVFEITQSDNTTVHIAPSSNSASQDYFISSKKLHNATKLTMIPIGSKYALGFYNTGSGSQSLTFCGDYCIAGHIQTSALTGIKMYKVSNWKVGNKIRCWGLLKKAQSEE